MDANHFRIISELEYVCILTSSNLAMSNDVLFRIDLLLISAIEHFALVNDCFDLSRENHTESISDVQGEKVKADILETDAT